MKIEYRAIDTANNVNKILKSTLKTNPYFHSLTSEYAEHGGFKIYKSLTRNSYFGPFIKAHTTVTNINWTGTASKVKMQRVNGSSYHIQLGICIIIIGVIFMLGVKEYMDTGKLLVFDLHVVPLYCIIYILLLELRAITAFKKLSRNIIRLIENEGIEVTKL
jgi:hypothetical protein